MLGQLAGRLGIDLAADLQAAAGEDERGVGRVDRRQAPLGEDDGQLGTRDVHPLHLPMPPGVSARFVLSGSRETTA